MTSSSFALDETAIFAAEAGEATSDFAAFRVDASAMASPRSKSPFTLP
jgi:hypothetical protein